MFLWVGVEQQLVLGSSGMPGRGDAPADSRGAPVRGDSKIKQFSVNFSCLCSSQAQLLGGKGILSFLLGVSYQSYQRSSW